MGISQSSEAWKSQFQQIQDQNNSNIKKINHLRTQQKYQLLSLYALDDEQSVLMNKLTKRQNIKSKYLQEIHSCQYVKAQNYCGDKKRYDIIFKQSSPTLENHLNYRRIKKQRFSNEEILYVIHNIALALKDFRSMGEDYGNVRFCNILVKDEVKLKDIILISEADHHFQNMTKKNNKIKKIKGFPSPQKLYTYFDSLTHFEEFTADLFSLGIVALQLYFLNQNMNNLYIRPNLTHENVRINIHRLNNFIQVIAEPQIKENISILTSQIANQRVQIYSRLKEPKIHENKIQMLKINPFAIYEQSYLWNGTIVKQTQISKPIIAALSERNNKQNQINIRQTKFVKPNNFIDLSIKRQKQFSNTPNVIFSTNKTVDSKFKQYPINQIYQPLASYRNDFQGSLPKGHSSNNQMMIHKVSFQNQTDKTKTPINFNIYSKKQSSIPTDIFYSKLNEAKHQSLSTPSPSILFKIPSFQQFLVMNSSNTNKRLPAQSLLQFNEIVKGKDITKNQNEIQNNIDQSKQPKDKNVVIIKNTYFNRDQITTEQNNQSVQKIGPISNISQQANKRPTSQLMKNEYEYVYDDKSKVSLSNEPIQKITLISILEQNQQKTDSSKQMLQAQNLTVTQKVVEQDKDKNNSNITHSSDNQIVIEKYQTGSLYEGKKKNGMRNGHGKILYQEGSYYIGEWKDNKMEGFGNLYYQSGNKAYQGYWKDDQFHGKGVVYNDQPLSRNTPFDYTNFKKLGQEWVRYQGELINDAKEGNGRLILTNGEVYQGQFSQDFVHGEGTYTKMDGSVIKGFWTQSLLTVEKI